MSVIKASALGRIAVVAILSAAALSAPASARPSTKGFTSIDYGCRYIVHQIFATIANLPSEPTVDDLRRAKAEIERLERAYKAAKCDTLSSGAAVDIQAAQADLDRMMAGLVNTSPAPQPPRFAVGDGHFSPPSSKHGWATPSPIYSYPSRTEVGEFPGPNRRN